MSGAVEGVELLPCPFCGWSAGNSVMDSGDEPYWVECADCYAQSGVAETRDAAIAAWNTRTTPPARSYADEDVARIIDWSAWSWHDRWLKEAETEKMAGRAASLRKDAKMHVAASLAKAASIRLLLQGGKA